METMTNAQMAWAIKNGFARYEQDNGSINDTIWTNRGGWQWFPPCIEDGCVRDGCYRLIIK